MPKPKKLIQRYFYIPYVGGKSGEIHQFIDLINLNNYDTIVEPFCGSCAVSYHLWTLDTEKRLKFHLNDIDPILISFLQDVHINGIEKYLQFCRDNWKSGETTREQYEAIKKQNTIMSWFYIRRIHSMRIGLYPTQTQNIKLNSDEFSKLDEFFMSPNVTITNKDYAEVMKQYENDTKAFIFLDPPYFLSFNDSYKNKGDLFGGQNLSKTETVDPTYAYSVIRKLMLNSHSTIIMIINECCLLKDYYINQFVKSYEKLYQMTKNRSRHMILSNKAEKE